jgi:DNA-binding protein HU-beta
MNKSGLVAEVAKRTDRNRAEIAEVVDEVVSVIRDTVAKGERVALVGFGTFEKRRRNRRVARNPRLPDVAITVPARDVPTFSPGQAFKQAVASKRRRAAPKATAKPAAAKSAARKPAATATGGGAPRKAR